QQRQESLARLLDGPGFRHPGRSREDDLARQACRQELFAEDLEWRSVEDRRRFDLGLYGLRSRTQPDLLRNGSPLALEPYTACGTGCQADRPEVVDDDVCS